MPPTKAQLAKAAKNKAAKKAGEENKAVAEEKARQSGNVFATPPTVASSSAVSAHVVELLASS